MLVIAYAELNMEQAAIRWV